MYWNRISHLGSLLVLLGSLVASAEISRIVAAEPVTLQGEIEIVEYDDDGNVASVAIYDEERGSILVSNSGKGRDLLEHVGAYVEVSGRLVESQENDLYEFQVVVTGYKVKRPEDDPDDDQDDDIPEEDEPER